MRSRPVYGALHHRAHFGSTLGVRAAFGEHARREAMIGAKVGHFTIKSKLGEGGMGAVYYAEHEILHTQRVIKVLLPQWTQSEILVQRFVNEARAAAAIRHRNIIQVHDCGQLPDGTWYIVMDYLEGETLARFGGSHGGPMSPHLALQILAPTANGLEAAHRAGIVHRDLKPDNICLIRHEQNPHHPIIIDFGIAKLGERDGGAITRTGMMAGTPAYMAPEQMRDLKLVDARSDVYALGVIAYQVVTGGYLPYQEESTLDELNQLSAAEIYHRQMSRPPIDPRERFPGISERWAAAIRAAIDPDPARRHPSPRAFVLKLAEATEGDSFKPSGTEIVRTYASELLEIGNLLETVRGPKPAVQTPAPARSRYQLGDRLGAGGMAEVFRGTMIGAEGIARSVAVKRVLPGLETPELVAMFVREAQLVSLLSHPNIVTILDFDRDPGGRPFLVMEYVEGRDLAKLVDTGLLPFSTVNFIISEILCGLGYAHELPITGPVRGLVHRDVSPHNVLVSWEGAVKVSDFGIAKAREASAATASMFIKGKVAYMSPEQANGEPLDGRSDLFAVGIMLWELLTGRALFDGTARETLAKVILGSIPRPSSIRPEIPADLEEVAMRLLERDKSARYARAELAIDDLASCADAPRNGRRELVQLLAARFPEAIAARVSRPQLADSQPSASASPSPQGEVTATFHGPRGGAPQPADSWKSSETTLGTAASQSVARSRRAARWPWLVASGLVLLGAAAGTIALAVAVRDTAPPPGSSAAAHSREAVAPAPGAVRDPRPTTPTITVVTEPPGAAVRVDGSPRGQAPLTIAVEPGRRLMIEAEHDGFEPAKQTITAEREAQTVTLSLTALPTAMQEAPRLPGPSPVARPTRSSGPSRRPEAPLRPQSGSASFDRDAVSGD
jgi:serine/threonine protein kinase